MGGIEVYAVPLYFRVRPKSPVATQRPFVGAPNAVAGMVNINRESKPTTAEANKLARDIESLFRECDTVVQMGLDKANMKNTVWGVTIGYLHGLAICVCNADGSVSEEEASLYYEIFAYLFQKGDTRVGDLQGVCTIIRDGYPKCRQAFGPALHVVWLEQNDRLNGTAYASRYRELVLRMANMLAAAEGVRSEKKLSFVGEIEKALSPATMTEMANMLAAAEGVRSEKKLSFVGETEKALSPAKMTASAGTVAALAQEVKKFAEELNDPVKRMAQNAVIVDKSGKTVSFTTLQNLIELDVFYLFTLFNYDDRRTAPPRAALWAQLYAELKGLPPQVSHDQKTVEDVTRTLRAQQRSPDTMGLPIGFQLVQQYDDICGTQNAQWLGAEYQRLVKLVAAASGTRDDASDKVVEKVEQVLFPERSEDRAAKRVASEPHSLDALLEELNALVGLPGVKSDVAQLANYIKVLQLRKQQGLKTPDISLHMVFYGNPGTGKTTVARLVANIYRALGVLSKGQLIETDRSGLVAGYVGQTALKVKEAVQRAIGGVLFVDEAYALRPANSTSDFGAEAIDTLLKLMEDHRDDFVVIVAGYTRPMERFLEGNPGLKSRFNKYLIFEDYSANQLVQIFRGFCSQSDYTLSSQAEAKLHELFEKAYANRDETFGNARFARNVFEKAIGNLADRIVKLEHPKRTAFELIEPDDIGVPESLSVKNLGLESE